MTDNNFDSAAGEAAGELPASAPPDSTPAPGAEDGPGESSPVGGEVVSTEPPVSELREQLSVLEARNAELTREREALVHRRATRHRARTALAVFFVVVGALLAPVSVISVWARNTVTNTDQYVATVQPLASDPAIQDAVSTNITNAIDAQINIPALLAETLPPQAQALQGPISGAVKNFISTTVSKAVTSAQFTKIWTTANRVAHAQLVAALEGKSSAGVSINSGKVTVDLSQLVTQVKQQLSAAGLTIVNKIPDNLIHGNVTVYQSNSVTELQSGFSLLNSLGVWLPIIALACLVIGVLLATGRRRAIAWAAFGILLTTVVFAIAFVAVRHAYLNALPASVSQAAGSAAFNILTRFLRQSAQALIAFAAIVWIVAFVSGPARGAGTLRRGVSSGVGHLGDHVERAGLLPGPVRVFVGRYRRWFQVADVALVVLVLALWNHRTAGDVLWMAVLGLVLLIVIEFIGNRRVLPATPGTSPAGEATVPAAATGTTAPVTTDLEGLLPSPAPDAAEPGAGPPAYRS
jgi:hypothetical protein